MYFSADVPSHVLVRFSEDDCLSVVPMKNVVEPDLPLKKGDPCTVKWSSGDLFSCTVIGLGKLHVMCCTHSLW